MFGSWKGLIPIAKYRIVSVRLPKDIHGEDRFKWIHKVYVREWYFGLFPRWRYERSFTDHNDAEAQIRAWGIRDTEPESIKAKYAASGRRM